MALINATALSKSFGPTDIFSELSFGIPRRARIGLVGPNGVGKTTLLEILIGSEMPSSGSVQRSKDLSIGYLPQEVRYLSEKTLWQECLDALKDLLAMEAQLKALEKAMSDPDEADQAIAAYGRLQEDFERRGGYTYENRIRQTLTGLGFTPGG